MFPVKPPQKNEIEKKFYEDNALEIEALYDLRYDALKGLSKKDQAKMEEYNLKVESLNQKYFAIEGTRSGFSFTFLKPTSIM